MPVDYETYRQTPTEKARTADLLRILPSGRSSVLDIGARDGHISKLLREYFSEVTALDLIEPQFDIPGVSTVQGDVTNLQFDDGAFDVICCLEVLEHIPSGLLARACSELFRVVKHELIIGVPYRQDTRLGRTTCRTCRKKNPPWGHVNTFDEKRLRALFPKLRQVSTTYIGSTQERTNALSAFLMDLAGNPWGTYNQEEPCVFCGANLRPPAQSLFPLQKACGYAASRLNALQSRLSVPKPIWIHTVFRKK